MISFKNACPKCGKTRIFTYFIRMRPQCSSCKYEYTREPGYFLGALVFSYIMGCLSVVPTLLISLFVLHASLFGAILVASIQIILITPLLFRFSRLLWINMDFRADSENPVRGA